VDLVFGGPLNRGLRRNGIRQCARGRISSNLLNPPYTPAKRWWLYDVLQSAGFGDLASRVPQSSSIRSERFRGRPCHGRAADSGHPFASRSPVLDSSLVPGGRPRAASRDGKSSWLVCLATIPALIRQPRTELPKPIQRCGRLTLGQPPSRPSGWILAAPLPKGGTAQARDRDPQRDAMARAVRTCSPRLLRPSPKWSLTFQLNAVDLSLFPHPPDHAAPRNKPFPHQPGHPRSKRENSVLRRHRHPFPVFNREGVERQVFHAEFPGGLDDFAHRFRASSMALDADQVPGLGPSAVARP